jgi:hypothetical protein
MPTKKKKNSDEQSVINTDNIKGFFEVYMDQELQGLKIDDTNVQKLYLTSVTTQTNQEPEPSNSSFERKYQKLLIKYKLLSRKYKVLKLKINKKNKKFTKIKYCLTILGLPVNCLKRCKGKNSTKTCRKIIQEIYPDKAVRATKRIANMDKTKIATIIGP